MGKINITSVIKAKIKALDIKSFLTMIDKNKYITPIKREVILNLNLFFLLIRGLLCVSAGAYNKSMNKEKRPSTRLIESFEGINFARKGKEMKIIDENIRQIVLVEACIPNAGILIKL